MNAKPPNPLRKCLAKLTKVDRRQDIKIHCKMLDNIQTILFWMKENGVFYMRKMDKDSTTTTATKIYASYFANTNFTNTGVYHAKIMIYYAIFVMQY